LLVLVAAVLYNVWYFTRPSPKPAARVVPQEQAPLLAAAATAPPAPFDPAALPAPPPVDLRAAPSWGRDPFLFGDESRIVAHPVAPLPAPVRPAVRTILYSSDRRLAIVNGRTVGVGDAVGEYTVADIERTAVVFTAPSGERFRVFVHAAGPQPVAR
jgi:hypothetical protein